MKKTSPRVSLVRGVLTAALITVVLFIWQLAVIIEEADAQGGIAIMFLMMVMPIALGVIFTLTWPIIELVTVLRNRQTILKADVAKKNIWLRILLPLLVFIFGLSVTIPFLSSRIARHEELATAGSEKTYQETLATLYLKAKTPYDHDLMMQLAENPNTPSTLLAEMAKDEYTSIRGRVAINPSTPVFVLEQLSRDREWVIRSWVAANPSTPETVLIALKQDPNEQVSVNAAHYLEQRKKNQP